MFINKSLGSNCFGLMIGLFFSAGIIGCNESKVENIIVTPLSIIIDSTDDAQFAILLNLENQANREVELYTGTDVTLEPTQDGLGIKFRSLNKKVDLAIMRRGSEIKLKPYQKRKRIVAVACFSSLCGYDITFKNVKDYYRTAKEGAFDYKAMLADLDIIYEPRANFQGVNYNRVLDQRIKIEIRDIVPDSVIIQPTITGNDFFRLLQSH